MTVEIHAPSSSGHTATLSAFDLWRSIARTLSCKVIITISMPTRKYVTAPVAMSVVRWACADYGIA